MLIQDDESYHKNNISRLNELYPETSQQAILIIYEDIRRRLEKRASMFDHVPPYTLHFSNMVLKSTYNKPLKKTQKIQEQPLSQRQSKRRGLLKLLKL